MFYDEASINKLIVCKVCDEKLQDPRVLPCGKSICFKCVDILSDTSKTHVKCQHCGKMHDIPHNGFLPNDEIAELARLKANDVKRGKKIEELKKINNSIKAKVAKLETDQRIGDVKIREHCDKVRNDIQIAVEEAHVKLDEFHKTFMNKVDSHEKVYQSQFKLTQQDKVEIVGLIRESNELSVKSEDLLKSFDMDEASLSTCLDKAIKMSKKLPLTILTARFSIKRF